MIPTAHFIKMNLIIQELNPILPCERDVAKPEKENVMDLNFYQSTSVLKYSVIKNLKTELQKKKKKTKSILCARE